MAAATDLGRGVSPLGRSLLQCHAAMCVLIVTLLIVLGLCFRSFLFPSPFVLLYFLPREVHLAIVVELTGFS